MNLKPLFSALALMFAGATQAFSAPITLDFAFRDFTDSLGDYTDFGTIYGLDNSDGVTSATSITYHSELSSFSIDATSASQNNFRFSNGELTDFNLEVLNFGADPAPRLQLLALSSESQANGVPLFNGSSVVFIFATREVSTADGPIVFTKRIVLEDQDPVAPVPLPASGVLLLGAIGFAGLRKIRFGQSDKT